MAGCHILFPPYLLSFCGCSGKGPCNDGDRGFFDGKIIQSDKIVKWTNGTNFNKISGDHS